MPDKSQIWLTPLELAARWQISPSAVNHRKCNADLLTPHRFGRNVRFCLKDIESAERVIRARGGRLPGRQKKPVADASEGD